MTAGALPVSAPASTQLSFFVAGKPQTKGSLRVWHKWQPGGRCRVGLSEQSGARLKEWRALVATAARNAIKTAPPFAGPVRVELLFLFERPASNKDATQWVWGNKRHDADKLQRAIFDALTDAAVFWADDSQVAGVVAAKRYCDGLERPGVHITVEALS